MDISEIVSAMHADVDRFEEVSLARDAKHKAEIGLLQEKFELERLIRLQAEEDLKKAQESYQSLLKKVKESGLRNANNIEESSSNNKLKRKQMDDNNSNNVVAELWNRVAELENENKKNLATIEELRAKNTELALNNEINADAEPCGNNEEEESLSSMERNILDTMEWCREQLRELRQNKGGASTREREGQQRRQRRWWWRSINNSPFPTQKDLKIFWPLRSLLRISRLPLRDGMQNVTNGLTNVYSGTNLSKTLKSFGFTRYEIVCIAMKFSQHPEWRQTCCCFNRVL